MRTVPGRTNGRGPDFKAARKGDCHCFIGAIMLVQGALLRSSLFLSGDGKNFNFVNWEVGYLGSVLAGENLDYHGCAQMVILSDNFYFNCNYTEDKGLFYKIYVKILKILFVYLHRTQIRSNNTQPNQLCQSIKIPLKKKSLFSPNTLNFPLIAHVISDIQCKKSKKKKEKITISLEK